MKFLRYIFILILIFSDYYGYSLDKVKRNKDSLFFKYIKRFQITPLEKSQNVKIITIIPQDYKNRQKITDISFSIKPNRIFNNGNNRYAEFVIENINENMEIYIKCLIEIFKYDLNEANKTNFINKFESKKSLSIYLNEEKFIESNDPSVIDITKQFNTKNKTDLVKQIYNFVISNMTFEMQKEEKGALFALNNKKGRCMEYSALFIALCRASGLPARQIYGYNPLERAILHAWAEVYLDNLGWVPFDPTSNCIEEGKSTFNNFANNYVYLSFKKKDDILLENKFDYAEIKDIKKIRVRSDIGFYLLIFK